MNHFSSHQARNSRSICVVDKEPACFYCCNCENHFCEKCDETHHAELPLHIRLPIVAQQQQTQLSSSPQRTIISEEQPPQKTLEPPPIVQISPNETVSVKQNFGEGAKLFASGLYNGLTGVFTEPIKGAKESGITGAIKGVGYGLFGLAANPIKGSIGLLENVAEGLRNKPEALFNSNNESIKTENATENENSRTPKHLGEGLVDGARGFGKGLVDGVTGIVTEPMKGAKSDGTEGFARGVGRGLVGVVVKPVAGAIDLLYKPVEGMINTPDTINEMVKKRNEEKASYQL
eukprot:TRINITY_DN6009_c0_g1_i1.p1 TRINITY_DN6009_c0_g1~~TRINITY_DN6009_c0_g1_i1.p1  ORF type:complete len:290 (+),score=45.70 TRINITY_DN6009_c0_g1_i1:130-999(+)